MKGGRQFYRAQEVWIHQRNNFFFQFLHSKPGFMCLNNFFIKMTKKFAGGKVISSIYYRPVREVGKVIFTIHYRPVKPVGKVYTRDLTWAIIYVSVR